MSERDIDLADVTAWFERNVVERFTAAARMYRWENSTGEWLTLYPATPGSVDEWTIWGPDSK